LNSYSTVDEYYVSPDASEISLQSYAKHVSCRRPAYAVSAHAIPVKDQACSDNHQILDKISAHA